MRERLKAVPDPILSRYVTGPALEKDAQRSFHNIMDINLAHALMLHKQGIVNAVDTRTLLDSMFSLRESGPQVLAMNPEYEDLFYNIEQYLIAELGIETAGKLHTARSRNDLGVSYLRMNVRDLILKLLPLLQKLRQTLLKMADEHKETILTGYTHMQPAQPITLGFYLSGIAEAMERDFTRILQAYRRLNLSAMGSCAFAGTGFAIDRFYMAELLGFDEPLENNMDSIAARDYLLELAGDFAILGTTIRRFATDLYYWGSNEFAYLEVDNSLAFSSSIMPQKKNPITLEQTKAKAAHLTAAFADIAGVVAATPYGHSKDLIEAMEPFYRSADDLEFMLVILETTLSSLQIKKDGMKERADRNYCTVTELSDELVKTEGLPFRQAYQIVGSVVGECVDAGLDAMDITAAMLDEAAEAFLGRKLDWSDERLRRVLDSAYSVAGKECYGGPGPKAMAAMLARLQERWQADEAAFAELEEQQRKAAARLQAEAESVKNVKG